MPRPWAGVYLECSRKSREVSVAGDGVGEIAGGLQGLALPVRPLAFSLNNMKNHWKFLSRGGAFFRTSGMENRLYKHKDRTVRRPSQSCL